MHPFSHSAFLKLNNYAIDLGIKNRFSIVRNELVEREQKNTIRRWVTWADRCNPEPSRFQTPDWRKNTFGLRRKFI